MLKFFTIIASTLPPHWSEIYHPNREKLLV